MNEALMSALLTGIVVLAACWVWTRPQRLKAQQWHAAVAGMPDGLMVVDRQLRLVEWNAHFAEYVGLPAGELFAGMPLEDILRTQARAGEFGSVDVEQEVARRITRFKSGEAAGTIERRRPNGRVLELRRERLPNGGFVTLYTDITEKRGIEEQLHQAQKMEAIGRLTSGLAHDFNNLLAIVIGNLELAGTAIEEGKAVRTQRKITEAQSGARRAAQLTQRLLAFSRRQILQPKSVDPNKIVTDMSDLIRHSLGGRDLEIICGASLWRTYIDPNQLESALLNLAINARDAMPDGGKLTIETANSYLDEAYAAAHQEVSAGQYVLVSVTDRGTGMVAADAARAFEPFFTTKEVGKGSGLGLSQVFGFVKQSKGHVKIYSELGRGTTVKLYLPRLKDHHTPDVIETGEHCPIPHAEGDELVLLVEDDAEMLAYTKDALETLGYRVVAAADPNAARSVLKERQEIALVLTDVELPITSGPEMVREMDDDESKPPVLYMTGYPLNDMLDRNMTPPDAQIIAKPFAIADLAKAVRRAIGGSHVTRRRQQAASAHCP